MIRSVGSPPPPILPAPSSQMEEQADNKTVPKAPSSGLPRFARRNSAPIRLAFKHRNHRNIDPESAKLIQGMEGRLEQASRSQHPGEVAELLHELLDLPFFRPVPQIPVEALSNLFSELDKCPIRPDETQPADFSGAFIRDLVALQKEHVPETAAIDEKALGNSVMTFLRSNRAARAEFQTEIGKLVQNSADMDSAPRGSAQKMALETFETTLSCGRLSKAERLDALKKLVDILPNLAHHEIAERNSQRRGLKLFEKLVNRLPPDEAAEMLTYLMNTISSLSQKLSRRQANIKGNADKAVAGLSVAVSFSPAIAVILGAAAAAVPFTPIPAAVAAGLFGASRYLAIRKQPQGSALYIVQDQLTKLRGCWSQVGTGKRQELIDAFNALRAGYARLEGTKASTLKRFFNNEFIDPSQFPIDAAPPGNELKRRLHHRLIAPVTSRMTGIVPERIVDAAHAASVPGYADATPEQKALFKQLHAYHVNANRTISPGFLANFIKNTGDPGFENAAGVVETAFSRVQEMAEYRNPISKPAMLKRIVEMTKRLGDGDKEFVQSFVSTCQLAGADCHNNARQIFRALENAVTIDKATKGEDGLDNESALVKLARGMFNEDTLRRVTDRVMAKRPEVGLRGLPENLEVEGHLAVQMRLGMKFGIPNPPQGMGYTNTLTGIVTTKAIEFIDAKTEKEITDDKFVEYLMTWDPLTEKLKASPSFKKELERKTAKAREKYEAAEDGVMEGTVNEEEFNDAAFEYQHATKATENALLEPLIKDIVAADSAGTVLDGDMPMAPSGLDEKAWKSFIEKLDDLPRSSTLTATGQEEFRQNIERQFTVPAPSGNAAVAPGDIPGQVMPTEGGGDCLFHALRIPPDEIGHMRKKVAGVIREEAENIEHLGTNALYVLAALSQTAATQHTVIDLMAGRENVSSEAYARLVEMRGIYAGGEELRLLSTLPEYRDKAIVAIDNDGTISTYRNGEGDTESCTPDQKDAQLRQAISGADIALYKTQGHWERIDLTPVAGPSQ